MITLNVSQRDVMRINHTAYATRRAMEQTGSVSSVAAAIHQYGVFPPTILPDNARTLEEWATDPKWSTNEDLCHVIEYLGSRGPDIATAMSYYWTPDTKNNMNRRLIIPMRYRGELVGWTGRACDASISQRYFNQTPDNFLFNADVLDDPSRKYVIVQEGPTDAIAIDGVSPLGSTLNDVRVRWLNSVPKIKIVVADRDRAGVRKEAHSFIDTALAQGWHVAFPRLGDGKGFQNWWEPDVKDTDQAVRRYGRLYVLRSIIESATDNKIEIETKRTRIV
jgi:hypothetical protein